MRSWHPGFTPPLHCELYPQSPIAANEATTPSGEGGGIGVGGVGEGAGVVVRGDGTGDGAGVVCGGGGTGGESGLNICWDPSAWRVPVLVL